MVDRHKTSRSRMPAAPRRAAAAATSTRAIASTRPGRRERHAVETRERILRSALSLFAERGLSAVTVEDITEAADVGKGTFFNYFESKEHALAALGDLQLEKLDGILAEAKASSGSLQETLDRFPGVMADEPGRSPLLVRSMMAAILSSEPVRRLFLEKILRARKVLAELISLGQGRGEIRADRPPSEIAEVLQQTFFGTMLVWSMDPSESLRRRMELAFAILGPGLATTPRERREEEP
jgi:AcrR family transcriptional regulator